MLDTMPAIGVRHSLKDDAQHIHKTIPSPVLAKSSQVDMEKVCKETFCWDSLTRPHGRSKVAHQSRSLHCSEPRKATSSKGNSAAPAGHSQQHFLPAVCFFLSASESGA